MSEKRTRKTRVPAVGGPAASPMDVGLLEKLVKLMSANDLNTVELRDGDRRVTLKRGAVVAMAPAAAATSMPAPAAATPPAALAAPQPEDQESKYLQIKSPMVGTFYAAPAKGSKPFVTVGSTVDEDTDICIIEAMKVFNNIKAECRGTIARILIQDGQSVEFGSVLFLVKPA